MHIYIWVVTDSVKSARWGGGDGGGRGWGVKCMRFAMCFEPWAQTPRILRGFRNNGLKQRVFCDVFVASGSKTSRFARFAKPWAQKGRSFTCFLEPLAQSPCVLRGFQRLGSKRHVFYGVFKALHCSSLKTHRHQGYHIRSADSTQ